jgi:ubiquinone/menaquinone biosynthesis C-methylase UbiE
MEAFGPDRIHSFDHYAINEKVTACDMKNVPFDDGKLDVVVFSLSLMGKNWRDYITEARRCLCTRGSMLIAETTRALANKGRLSKLREVIQGSGFVIDLDEERGEMDDAGRKMFTFLEATKL